MKRCGIIEALILATLIFPSAFARTEDRSRLSLDRLFSPSAFSEDRFGPARWLEDGSGYTTLEPAEGEGGGRDIVRCDPASGERTVLVPAERLIPPGGSAPLEIDDYAWSPDRKGLLVFTNTRRVWRRNTRGDYWVLDLEDGTLKRLGGGDAAPSTLMFAKFDPSGRRVAYVRENNIYVEDLDGGGIVRLTADGSETIINGTFDWVYEEEFALRDGFRWSPDGKRIAYWRLDTGGVGVFKLINNTDGIYPRIIPVQYPKVGTANSACRVGVVDAGGGATTWLDVPGDPRNHYIARMDWAESSGEIVLQQLNRLQNTNRVMLGDAATGEVKTVFIDRDGAWLDVGNGLKWLEGGERFSFVSERDGWRHVFLVSRSGDEVRCVTPGDFDVMSVEHIDDGTGELYYAASPDHAARRYLYRTALDGKGEAERVTPEDRPGWHTYRISPDGCWAFHTHSAFGVPPRTELVRLPGHEAVRVLAGNASLRAEVEALDRGPAEFFRIDIGGGVELDGWCIKPPRFDPEKRWPVLFHVYGEPAGQTVLDRWGGFNYLWHLMLAQRGYVIMSVDNRGTPGPRGRAWRKSIYRQIGILASSDQAAAVRALEASRPWMDPDRTGIWGWSGGGSMSLNAILRYPELYETAVSIAPVCNQRLYDTIYQERYMGLPEDNEEGYEQGSPVTFAHQLEGNLLVVHGTGDDNCHYQGTELLINALIEANKHFTMMAYPNRGHGIYEGENTRRHLFELLTRYLEENL